MLNLDETFRYGPIRFAVASAQGLHSGLWSVWGSKSDYYFGARSIIGDIKVSLHQSGFCRIALNDARARTLIEQGLIPAEKDRAFTKWRKPNTPTVGTAQVATLIFPVDYLRNAAPAMTPKKPAIVFTADAPGNAVELGLFYSRESEETLLPKLASIGQPLFHTVLQNGEMVHVIARIRAFDPNVLPNSDKLNAGGLTLLSSKMLANPQTEVTGLNAVFWNAPKDGESFQMLEIGGVSLRP